MSKTFQDLFFKILNTPQGLAPSDCSYKKTCNANKVIYKKIWVPIIRIEYKIFAWSNTILSIQNARLLC